MINISVIVPVYKVEKYLPKCIDSLLSQTIQNIEIILVDDGSPDNSGAICDEYAAKDSRIKVIHKQNGGLGSARNAGLEIAKGDYVSFIDSDDWIEEDYLSAMYNQAVKYSLDIVVGGVAVDFTNENRTEILNYGEDKVYTSKDNIGLIFQDLTEKRLANYAWNKLYCREFLTENQFLFDKQGMPAEDLLFNLECFTKLQGLGIVANAGYHYMRNGDETILTRYHSHIETVDQKRVKALKAFFNHFNITNEMQSYMNSMQIGLHCLHIGNIFKKDSPLSFSEKVKWYRKFSKEHKAEILDLNSKLPNPGFLVKLMIFSLRFNSPVLAISFYSLIFFMRYQFVGLYLKIKRGRF